MRSLLLMALALSLTGCASLFNDSHQKINVVTSNNTAVKGTIDGVSFAGPGIVSVQRSKLDKVIVVDGDACTKQTVMTSSVDTVFWINILGLGSFGSSTDYSTDKMWKYQDTIVIPCK